MLVGRMISAKGRTERTALTEVCLAFLDSGVGEGERGRMAVLVSDFVGSRRLVEVDGWVEEAAKRGASF